MAFLHQAARKRREEAPGDAAPTQAAVTMITVMAANRFLNSVKKKKKDSDAKWRRASVVDIIQVQTAVAVGV